MKSSKEIYYNITKNAKPHLNVLNFINLNVSPGKAVDLGCGAGRDTIELLKNNWNVLSIDKEDTETIIREQLNQKEAENFKFKKCFFGEMNLPKVNLIVANFSLPFSKKELFSGIWKNITNSLSINGYFVGNFFGKRDTWAETKENLIFLTEQEVKALFSNFELIQFNEIEKDALTASGEKKHWHIYDVIAQKKI